jgi:hypothetical protein
MYGFSGYATNPYASSRFSGTLGPVVKIANTILRSFYGIGTTLLLRFKNTTLEL